MSLRLQNRLITLLQAMAIAWPDSIFALELHTPGPIPPVDDDDDEDDDAPGRGSGGSIDPDDDEDDDDDDDDEETLWTVGSRRSLDPRQVR